MTDRRSADRRPTRRPEVAGPPRGEARLRASGRRPLAVILDMDGTLLDTEPVAARAWFDAAGDLGVGFDPALPHRLIGRTFTDCRALIVEAHDADYPVDALMARWHAAYDAIVEREGVALKPGAAELVEWLAAEDIARAVATSTRRARALVKLEHAALAARMQAVVGGDEVARGKPAPDIFLAAAERLGVAPGDCVVVEDSAAGVAGALAAGMAAIMVPDLVPPDDALRASGPLVLDSLHHAREHLAGLPEAPRRRTIVR